MGIAKAKRRFLKSSTVEPPPFQHYKVPLIPGAAESVKNMKKLMTGGKKKPKPKGKDG
eukprot:NODE_3072_length_496_cov_150.997763_g2661_i0.p4 GENE.NODE_3072_length_496_cov_150.997763_g2661_i0~~NODE_3072_length_496_cov_150.997763_g2661_i0.p4  ORF type:complete len:58 (-),score=8.19 NODE_3072_length_496_cov_150.997763_g2661_i0:291-464(-)